MSLEDLNQFVYNLNAKFDAECRYTEGIAEAVSDHADQIDEAYGAISNVRKRAAEGDERVYDRMVMDTKTQMAKLENIQQEAMESANKLLRDQLDEFVQRLGKDVHDINEKINDQDRVKHSFGDATGDEQKFQVLHGVVEGLRQQMITTDAMVKKADAAIESVKDVLQTFDKRIGTGEAVGRHVAGHGE